MQAVNIIRTEFSAFTSCRSLGLVYCVVAKCSSVSKEFTAVIIRVTVVSGGCCSGMDGKNFVDFVG
jgi:hypothetical protein